MLGILIIFVVWVGFFLWGLLSLLGVLANEKPAWIVSLKASGLCFIVYSIVATIVILIKFIWIHLPDA